MKIPKTSYVVDNEGKKTFVQLSINDWERFIEDVLLLEKQLAFKKHLQESFQQVQQIKNGETKGETLNNFLNEL